MARQEADGSWGGIQPPMVYSTIALVVRGYPLDHPVVKAALSGLERFTLDDEQGRRIEACQSPIWDTALAVIALVDAGVRPDDPSVQAAVEWLLDKEVTVVGDWAVRRPTLPPGGWSFEFANVNYPDIDDTAEVVLALRRATHRRSAPACERALDWVAGMRSSDGGWGAFDADNNSQLPNQLPFFDFGAVTDPPTADVTAHVVEMLACENGPLRPGWQEALRDGLEWLSANQEPDGSYWGRWGVNYVYGTGAVLPALIAAGVPPGDPRVADGVRWLVEHQNSDGGWGEDLRSYVEPGWVGRGDSTASQTAWALIGLLAAGERDNPATERGVEWLVRNQTEDGTWDEPWFTGTGFPWDFSLNYHLYRQVFPVTALGRYVLGTGPLPKTAARPKTAAGPKTVARDGAGRCRSNRRRDKAVTMPAIPPPAISSRAAPGRPGPPQAGTGGARGRPEWPGRARRRAHRDGLGQSRAGGPEVEGDDQPGRRSHRGARRRSQRQPGAG